MLFRSKELIILLPPQNASTSPRKKNEFISTTVAGDGYNMNGTELRSVLYPMNIVKQFVDIAEPNTRNRTETCGILCGSEHDERLYVKNILIPDQKGTPDSCTTLNYEAILNYVMMHDMIVLGWIHTHPEYDCFLSSIDLHTHYGYQKLLPEAIAIVCSGLMQIGRASCRERVSSPV